MDTSDQQIKPSIGATLALFTSIIALVCIGYSLTRTSELIAFSRYEFLVSGGYILCLLHLVTLHPKGLRFSSYCYYFLGMLALPIAGSLLSLSFSRFVFLLGYVAFLINLFRCIKGKLITASLLAAVAISSMALTVYLSSTSYANPNYVEQLFSGEKAHVDTLFHASIAHMWKNYRIVSTGVDGLEFLQYHFFSHIYYASIAEYFHLPVLQVYAHFHYIFAAPALLAVSFVAVLYVCLQLHLNSINILKSGLLLFAVVFFNRDLSDGISFLSSESYIISMLIFVPAAIVSSELLQHAARKGNYLVLCVTLLFLLLIAGCKISSGFFYIILLLYFTFKHMLIKRDMIQVISGVIYILIILLLYWYSLTISVGSSFGFASFHYYRNQVWPGSIFSLYIYYFISGVFFLIYYSVQFCKEWLAGQSFKQLYFKNKYLLAEVLILTIAVCSIPGIVTNLSAASAGYFMIIPKFAGTLFLIALLFNYLLPKKQKLALKIIQLKKGLLLVLFSITIFNILPPFTKAIANSNQLEHNTLRKYHFIGNYYSRQLLQLAKLEDDIKQKMVVNIMQGDSLFWQQPIFTENPYYNHWQVKSFAAAVPAITGIFLVDGVPFFHGRDLKDYGYADYEYKKTPTDTLTYEQMLTRAQKFNPEVSMLYIIAPGQERIYTYNDTTSFFPEAIALKRNQRGNR